MSRTETLSKITSTGAVAVIRMTNVQKLTKVVEAIRNGGVKCIEITMTVPGAVKIIADLVKTAPADVCVGAGTVTDRETASAVIDAGATFVVGPVLNLEVITVCRNNDVVCMPGCFSPTEILNGWNAGADIIKVFPATSLGPKYFKDIAGPFPNIRMMPTGGVTVENVGEWVNAGAVAVGIGSDLLDKKAIDEERYEVLTERARRLTKNFQDAVASKKK